MSQRQYGEQAMDRIFEIVVCRMFFSPL